MTGYAALFADVAKGGDWYDLFISGFLPALDDELSSLLGLGAVSSSSLAIGTGSKTFSLTPADREFPVNSLIRARRIADPAVYMIGLATAASAGSVTVNVVATAGAGTHSDWIVAPDVNAGPARMGVRAITGADTVTAADHGAVLLCSGTFSLAFQAVATLGAGFYCVLVFLSGTVTLDPDGSEQIEGASSIAGTAGMAMIVGVASGALRVLASKNYPAGISSPGSSTDYGLALWSGTAGAALRAGIAPGSKGFSLISGGAGANHAYEPIPRRNYALNGGFEIWQRGSSWSIAASASTTAAVYGPDRWALHTNANQACTVSRQAGLVDGSRYSVKVQRNNGQTGTGVLRFEQAFDLDQLTPLVNRAVVLSFYVKKGADYTAALDALAVKVYTGTGAAARRGAGSYTTEATPISQTVTLTASAVAYEYTATIPSGTTQLSIAFEYTPQGTASADDSFSIDDLQLGIGAIALPFERRSPAEELLDCQRYFARLTKANGSPIILAYGIVDGAANAVSAAWALPAPMRTDPSVAHSAITNLVARATASGSPASDTISSVSSGPYMVGSIATVKYTTAGSTLTNLTPLVISDGNAGGNHDFSAEV